MQSRKHSAVEVATSTSIGFIGSWMIMWIVLKCWPHWPTSVQTTVITGLCTVWSIVRGYFVRRYFNHKTEN